MMDTEELKQQIVGCINEFEEQSGAYIEEYNLLSYTDLCQKISEILLTTDIKIENVRITRSGIIDINSTDKFPNISIQFIKIKY
jgi:hypothetical protein